MTETRTRPFSFHLRLTEDEMRELQSKSARTGMNPQAYLISLLENVQPKECPPVEFFDVLKNLRQINNNLNQIAVKANRIGFVDTDEYRRNVKWLQLLMSEMMEAMY